MADEIDELTADNQKLTDLLSNRQELAHEFIEDMLAKAPKALQQVQ